MMLKEHIMEYIVGYSIALCLCGLLTFSINACAVHGVTGSRVYSFEPQDIPTFEWSTVVVDEYLRPVFDLKCNLKVDTIDQLLPCRYDGTSVYVSVPQYADGWMGYLMVKASGYEVKVARVRLLSNATGPSIYMTPENIAQ